MTTQGWVYLNDDMGNPVELINHARTRQYLRTASIPGITVTDVIDAAASECAAIRLDPWREHPGLTLLRRAVGWWTAGIETPGASGLLNRGTVGPLGNAMYGTSEGSDTGDPRSLIRGDSNFVYTTGVTGNGISTPDAAALDITGDIEFEFIFHPTAVPNFGVAAATPQMLLGKEAAGQNSWAIRREASRRIGFVYSIDGTARLARQSAVDVPAGTNALKVEVDVDNGATQHVVRFYASADYGENYTLLSTVTTAGVISLFSSNSPVYIGDASLSGSAIEAGFQRVVIRNGIGGPAALDVDTSVVTHDTVTFTAVTGQTMTIRRSAAGRKTQCVDRDIVLLGTDDYLQVAHHEAFDPGDESFTVLANIQQWATPPNFGRFVAKRTSGANEGWEIENAATALSVYGVIDDGPSVASRLGLSVITAGALQQVGMILDADAETITTFSGTTVSSPASTAGLGPIQSTAILTIGRLSTGYGHQDFSFTDVAILPWAATAGELADIRDYLESLDETQAWEPLDIITPGDGDTAPWFDGSVASTEALGIWVEEWTGMDGGHHTRSTTTRGARPGGATFGPISHRHRAMKVNVLLFASTERGMTHLARWLESTLLNACDLRSTAQMWVREHCPADDNYDDGVLLLRDVVLIEGPTDEAPPIPEARTLVRRKSFSLAAGDPCLYGIEAAVGVETSLWSPTERMNLIDVEDEQSSQAVQRIQARSVPDLAGGDPFAFESTRQGAIGAPIVTITSEMSFGVVGDTEVVGGDFQFGRLRRLLVPALTVYIVSDTINRAVTASFIERDPIVDSQLVARVDLRPFPSGSELIVNFATRSIGYRDIAGAGPISPLIDGWRWVADRGQRMPRWTLPTDSCVGGNHVAVRPTFDLVADQYPSGDVVRRPDVDGNRVGNVYQFQWDVAVSVVDRWGCV